LLVTRGLLVITLKKRGNTLLGEKEKGGKYKEDYSPPLSQEKDLSSSKEKKLARGKKERKKKSLSFAIFPFSREEGENQLPHSAEKKAFLRPDQGGSSRGRIPLCQQQLPSEGRGIPIR